MNKADILVGKSGLAFQAGQVGHVGQASQPSLNIYNDQNKLSYPSLLQPESTNSGQINMHNMLNFNSNIMNANSKFKNNKSDTNLQEFTNNLKAIRSFEYKLESKSTKSIEFLINSIISFLKNSHQTNSKINNIPGNSPRKSDIFDDNCFTFSYKELNQKDEELIIKSLFNNFIFNDYLKDSMEIILNELIMISIPKDKAIFEEGDEGNYFYIISSGEVERREKGVTGQTKNIYKPGDSFGEIALLTLKNRMNTFISLSDCVIYMIDGEKFRDIQKRKNENILKERFEFLNAIAIFKSLDKISKYNVAERMSIKKYKTGAQIIKKGETGDKLYMIKEGLVSCRILFHEIRKLGVKDTFGENACLIDIPRGADVITLQKTVCYELSREDLSEALGRNYRDVITYCFLVNCIEHNEYLKSTLTEDNLLSVFRCLSMKFYEKQERIYNPKSNDPLKSCNKKIIVLVSGNIFKGYNKIAEKGEIIGTESLTDYSQGFDEEYIAFPDCISLEGTIDDFAKIMKIDFKKEREINIGTGINKLKKIYLFKNLSEQTLEEISLHMKKKKFKPDEVIVQEGTKGDTFILITKGRVKISKEGKFIRELEAGSYLGENSLLTENLRTATATAIDKVVCYVISKDDFDKILSDKETRKFLLKKLALQDTSIVLSDLYYIKFLGKGKFGSVSLVHNKKNTYAIKAISRNSVDKEKILARYFINERRIMLSLDHPFIVKMVKSMRNDNFCFLLIENINGKNLDEYLSEREKKKSIYETQFYIGSMLLMLDYLQKKFIAHRDIKPSNIMIDSNGYLKLIDFGTAKVVTDYTSTIVGTPHYIAPEILQGKGYSLSCDFWSVGICMFEIFYGIYPFGNYANEVMDIYKEILHKDFSFPSSNEKYQNVNLFIKDLLNKKVNQRICNFNYLKKKPFFTGIEFDRLNDFKLEPPFIPPTQDTKHYLANTKKKYEDMFKEDPVQKCPKKGGENSIPADYNPNWANEF